MTHAKATSTADVAQKERSQRRLPEVSAILRPITVLRAESGDIKGRDFERKSGMQFTNFQASGTQHAGEF